MTLKHRIERWKLQRQIQKMEIQIRRALKAGHSRAQIQSRTKILFNKKSSPVDRMKMHMMVFDLIDVIADDFDSQHTTPQEF